MRTLVGLEPFYINDIETFTRHRSRIPTNVFKSIIEDMNIMLMQYGPAPEQMTEETRSRSLSPVISCTASILWKLKLTTIDLVGFSFRNLPELIIEGRMITKGRIEYYFKAFGPVC